jgi:hypothetical protein
MSQLANTPDLETRNRHVATMREICRNLDNVTMTMDELIAQIDLDIHNSALTAYRMGKAPKFNSFKDIGKVRPNNTVII